LPGGPLAPIYDDLTTGTGVTVAVAAILAGGPTMPASTSADPPPAATLVGSNEEAVTVAGVPAATTVRIATAAADIAAAPAQQRLFLNLENIRGAAPSGVLSVYVSLPAQGAAPAAAPELADTVTLFGLAKATASDGPHGGNGLTVAIDITELAKSLAAQSQSSLDQLQVWIQQPGGEGLDPISIGRVSIFRQSVE
jgi:tyrosinase